MRKGEYQFEQNKVKLDIPAHPRRLRSFKVIRCAACMQIMHQVKEIIDAMIVDDCFFGDRVSKSNSQLELKLILENKWWEWQIT